LKWEDLGISGVEDLDRTDDDGLTFGKENQLTIIGRLRSPVAGDKQGKRHIVECTVCREDPELFGDGIFPIQLIHLVKEKRVPCGCSVSPKWTEPQMRIRATRKCIQKGYTFIDWDEPYKANTTRIRLLDEFGLEDKVGLANLLIGQNSSNNRKRMTSLARSKTDEEVIETFLSTNAFHKDSKFWKSDRLDDIGQRTHWWMECGECQVVAESYRSNLQKGKRPCGCSKFVGQKNMYIHILYEEDIPIAIKFGKTHYPKRRLKEQQNKCHYTIECYGVWGFENGHDTTIAEQLCRAAFICGVVSVQLMQDGWSETTFVYNLEALISIYESNGGVRQ